MIETKRNVSESLLRNDIISSRGSSCSMVGFNTSQTKYKVHRDRRVFGEFPGAGSVKPGEVWEEGLESLRESARENSREGGVPTKVPTRARTGTTDSVCSAIVEVKKIKHRRFAPGIVRVTLKWAAKKGEKSSSVCEIDTHAALWEIFEGIRWIAGVQADFSLWREERGGGREEVRGRIHTPMRGLLLANLVRNEFIVSPSPLPPAPLTLARQIKKGLDVVDGDVLNLVVGGGGIGEQSKGGGFSKIARTPMSYMRSVSPANFGLPRDVAAEEPATKKKKKGGRKKLKKKRIEYDENGHMVSVKNVRKVKREEAKREEVVAKKVVAKKVVAKKVEGAGSLADQILRGVAVKKSERETPVKQLETLRRILDQSPAANSSMMGAPGSGNRERGARMLVDFRRRGPGGGEGGRSAAGEEEKKGDPPVIQVRLF